MAMAVRKFNSQHFPTNLHDLLDEAEQENHSHIVSWCAQGQAFQFHYDDVLVVPSLLARYFTFRPTKFKSFLHQLQSYGFHRTSRAKTNRQQEPGCGDTGGVVIVMSHPLFIRGKRSLCLRMARKATATSYSSSLPSLISLRALAFPPKSASSPNMNMNINMNSNSNFYAPKTTVSRNNNNIKAKAFRRNNSAPIFGARRKAITDLSDMKNATFELKQEGQEEQQQQPLMLGVGMRSFTAAASSSFQRRPRRRSLSPPGDIRVLNPCRYMMKLLVQHSESTTTNERKTKPLRRIDSFSMEQALYFEPYQVSEIKIELLKALRASNLDQLRSLIQLKEEKHTATTNTNQMFTMSEHEEEEEEDVGQDSTNMNLSSSVSAAASAASSQPLLQLQDLKARNQFGETLLHLACRMGISRDILEFLVDEPAKVPLNVRDKFGRTPLHNSCLSTVPHFDNIHFVISKAPRTLLFEDDNGKVPFELIPLQCYEQWTQFLLSEEETGGKQILRQAAQAIPW